MMCFNHISCKSTKSFSFQRCHSSLNPLLLIISLESRVYSDIFLGHSCSSSCRLTFWESTAGICHGKKKTHLGTQTQCERVMYSLHLSFSLSLSLISLKTKADRHTWHFHFRPTQEQWMWIPHPGFITIHCPQVCLHFSSVVVLWNSCSLVLK